MTATIPPPPPAPTPDNTRQLDTEAARQQIRDLKRAQREARKQRTLSTLRGVNPAIWVTAGVGVAVFVTAVVGARWWSSQQQFQRDTAIALAAARGEQTTATSQPQPTQGMDNPLLSMPLTPQARWIIGPTADGTGLLPGRSTVVVRQILEGADVCKLFVSIDGQNVPRVTKDPATPGAVPLVDCTTTKASASTTAKPTTTAKQGE